MVVEISISETLLLGIYDIEEGVGDAPLARAKSFIFSSAARLRGGLGGLPPIKRCGKGSGKGEW